MPIEYFCSMTPATTRHFPPHVKALCHGVLLQARYYVSCHHKTRNSAIADKPRDALCNMQWRGWPAKTRTAPCIWLSSSSLSSAPISERSRLHKLTPLWTILRTHPRCAKTNVVGPKVELYCTEPCPPWSTHGNNGKTKIEALGQHKPSPRLNSCVSFKFCVFWASCGNDSASTYHNTALP